MDASPIDADERVGRAGNILKPAGVSSQAKSGAASCTMLWHSGLSSRSRANSALPGGAFLSEAPARRVEAPLLYLSPFGPFLSAL
eukprot:scaffold8005_cov118-Isochrysis_galbana.AAC.12